MKKLRSSKNKSTVGGRSYLFNAFFILLNFTGLALIVLGALPRYSDYFLLLSFLGYTLLVLTAAGLFIFEGRLMMANIARFILGGVLITSGLIKLNDPLGFSYKLEEYFEDGALAYRIKELFGSPGFSLEFLIDSALGIGIFVCILEIVFGILLVLGGKVKLVSYSLLLLLLFFAFLTWHTAGCDPEKRFIDRDTYEMGSALADQKLKSSRTNKDVRIVSKNAEGIVVEEKKSVQCVEDCGCFGDALKGSLGRSLTPKESFWKDLVLLYLTLWVFVAQWILEPNSRKQNIQFLIAETVLLGILSWLFGWYLILVFGILLLIGSLWVKRAGGPIFGNDYGVMLFCVGSLLVLTIYVLRYEPLKDFRPYAVGSNLMKRTKDGEKGTYSSVVVYQNKESGALKEFDANSKEYASSGIWEDKKWNFVRMVNKAIIPPKLPSITEQFNPVRSIKEIGPEERTLEYVVRMIQRSTENSLKLRNRNTGEILSVNLALYDPSKYPDENFKVLDTLEMIPSLSEVSIRELIFKADRILVLVVKDLEKANWSSVGEYKSLMKECKKRNIPFVMICNGNINDIRKFRNKFGFSVPAFTNDDTELKVIARSNPSLMVIEKGIVKSKHPHRSIPEFGWLERNIFTEK